MKPYLIESNGETGVWVDLDSIQAVREEVCANDGECAFFVILAFHDNPIEVSLNVAWPAEATQWNDEQEFEFRLKSGKEARDKLLAAWKGSV